MIRNFEAGDRILFVAQDHDRDCYGKVGVVVCNAMLRDWSYVIRFDNGEERLAHSSDLRSDESGAVAGFVALQSRSDLHPLTCGNDSSHPPLVVDWLEDIPPVTLRIKCIACGYGQSIPEGASLWSLLAGIKSAEMSR